MADTTQQRAAELFIAALDVDPATLATFLDEHCTGDTALRQELETLLAADVRADEFMAAPPEGVQSLAGRSGDLSDLLVGQTVGCYRIARQLGSGGMGTVYEASDERLGRTVALKVVRSGFASAVALRRFEHEARLLARLRHPAIAQIYEVGTHPMPGGSVPYFAMEFVPNARTILDYVRERSLTTRDRLELFAQVCDAVHYGHQRGVIHRDLKPGNLLIGEEEGGLRSGVQALSSEGATLDPGPGIRDPRPKVIDFGVARLVDADPTLTTIHTTFGQLIGTLQYMSPEQCPGAPGDAHDVDVRTDIYSLGVVLYELLCGRPPYAVQQLTLLDATRVIREQPPPRLGSGAGWHGRPAHEFRGDLDTIVRKALEKDRNRRYPSAGELAEDVRRYLADEPISARPPSVTYQLGAFARRNKALVAGVTAVFLVLVLGIVATSLQAVRARRSEQQARGAADAAQRSESNAIQSERLANLRLRDTLIGQAHAMRLTGQVGQRFEALEALRKSARIDPTRAARNEAIAAMALPDLRRLRQLKRAGTAYFDSQLERCAVMHDECAVTVIRVADDQEIANIPAPAGGCTEVHWGTLVGPFYIGLFDTPAGNPGHDTAVSTARRHLEVWSLPDPKLHLALGDVPDRARYDISADGKRLVVGRQDQAIHIYDLESGQEVQRIPLDRAPSYLRFDPSGRRIVLFHNTFVKARILDLDTGQSEPAFEADNIAWSVSWHPDGNLLAGANRTRVELWDCKARRSRGMLTGHQAQIVHVQFSHDGTMILTYSWDGAAYLWDAGTLRPLLRFHLAFPIFSPDDQRIAGTSFSPLPGGPEILELDGALERRRLIGGGEPEQMVDARGAFESSSGLLVTAEHFETERAGMRVFDVVAGRELAMSAVRYVEPLALDPLGRFALTGHNDGVYRWPLLLEGGSMIVGPPQPVFPDGPVSAIELSANGQSAILAGYSPREFAVLDLAASGAGTPASRSACPVGGGMSISPDGRWAAVTTGRVAGTDVWDLHGNIRVLQLPLSNTAFSPDSAAAPVLASCDATGASIREVGSWRMLRQAPGLVLGRLRYSPDARILAATLGPTMIELLDGNTLERLATLEPPESYYTTDFAFSPDGTILAQITNRAGVVHLWDLRRIRSTLASMELDWNQPPIPPPLGPAGPGLQPLRVTFDLGALAPLPRGE